MRRLRRFSLAGSYDWAHVRRNKEPYLGWNNINPLMPNEYDLKGYGIAARYQWRANVKVEAMYARKVGDHPGASASGLDADGSADKGRYWLNLTVNWP